MTKRNAGDRPGDSRDLENLLVRSFDTLRESPQGRQKFPALDRMLSRIEARERRVGKPGPREPSAWRWARLALPPLTAAAAGFIGAALALVVLPGPVPPAVVERAPGLASPSSQNVSRDLLDRSLQRLEDAVHGLEKFQPLLESRIEWIEDVVQREHSDAYVSVESKRDVGRERSRGRSRRGNGV